jgi:hypothetical protein
LENFKLPEELVQKLAGLGVRVEVQPDRVVLNFEKLLDLNEIKKIWDKIAEALPDLGGPAVRQRRLIWKRRKVLEKSKVKYKYGEKNNY